MEVDASPAAPQPFLETAKWTFTTRRVQKSDATHMWSDVTRVRPGDLVLAAVERIGNHKRVQLADGRFSTIFLNDLVVLCCADRFAPDQFSGRSVIDPAGASLLAGGGVIGELTKRNGRVGLPTRLKPLGAVCDETGAILNIADYALSETASTRPGLSLLVVGTSMNSGKTAAAAGLVNGFSRLGHDVAALKLTGTGAFGDLQMYEAAGADRVLDFTDAGLASTHCQSTDRLLAAAKTLLGAVADHQVCVSELADGVAQAETQVLLEQPDFLTQFDAVLLAVHDPLSAEAALTRLEHLGITPMALTGRITSSAGDLAELRSRMHHPIFSREELCDPVVISAVQSLCKSKHPKAA
ncbi:hypothetical protein [uncultured Roseobacter sp.]|uniref:hypothetical protein n=1 Tax=uncultured Roseobacter sp. TaxID=114847 RepID=UPI00260C73D6|nr:hypothetical protein [uncultured Roseobacter sp.]